MKFDKKFLAIAIVAGLILTIFGIKTYSTDSNNPFNFGNEVVINKDSKNTIQNIKEEQDQIYVIYKDTCPVCKANLVNIRKELRTLADETGSEVYYVNATAGLPDWFINSFVAGTFDGVKAPYLIRISTSDKVDNKFNPSYAVRLMDSDIISGTIQTILELNKANK